MKAHNPIDDMFQQHFAETTVPMNNQEELWTRISKKKDDKRRGFFWFGSLGLIVCAIVGFGIINLNNNTDQNKTSNYIASAAILEEENESPNDIENDQILLIEEENKEKIILESKSTVIVPETNEKIISHTNEGSVRAASLVQNITTIKTSNVTLKSQSIALAVGNSSDDDSVNSKAKKAIRNKMNLKLSDLDIDHTQLSSNDPLEVVQTDSWSKCEVKTPGHFFVDVYGQSGLSMDKVALAQSTSDQNTYRDLWDTRFDPVASWHGGAQIGYEFRNGLRVSAGAEYQELITEYADNQQITETIRVWDPQAFFTTDPNGDRVWVGDTVTAINIYERRFVRKNTHTLFHIPVQFSYDLYKKPGFHVAVDVAAALNLSKTYTGQFIRSDQTLIMVDDNNQDNYISKDIGMSFSAGLHLGKYFNDNWEVYVSPRFRYNPNSFLLDTETLKITRNMIGLRAGVRYHF